jgi:23S rRNA pseudouridine955/2504/2580 synthase
LNQQHQHNKGLASIRLQLGQLQAGYSVSVFRGCRLDLGTCSATLRNCAGFAAGRQSGIDLTAPPWVFDGSGLNFCLIKHLHDRAGEKHYRCEARPRGCSKSRRPKASGDAGAPPSAIKFLTVDAESAGQRLDNFLFRHLKGVPKTHVYRIIRSGEVRINKGRAQADTRIEVGDVLRLPPVRISPRAEEGATRPRRRANSRCCWKTTHVLAIDKPAGVAVHGGSGVSFGVIEQLRTARPGAKFLELVHRLDRETSGILLVAKKRSALLALQDQFRERETGKTYLALVEGAWPANKKVLDAPLPNTCCRRLRWRGAGERRVRVVAKDHPDAMRAITLVRVLARLALPGDATPLSLLAVTIKTGRTHQIRVHLASAGHPIAGDDKYGDFERQRALQKLGLKRMFLHAWRLQFNHPASGEPRGAAGRPAARTAHADAARRARGDGPTPHSHVP